MANELQRLSERLNLAKQLEREEDRLDREAMAIEIAMLKKQLEARSVELKKWRAENSGLKRTIQAMNIISDDPDKVEMRETVRKKFRNANPPEKEIKDVNDTPKLEKK